MSDVSATTPKAVMSTPKRGAAMRWSALIFLCGVLVGGGLSLIGMNYFLSYRFRHPEEMLLRIVDQMQGNLKLSEDQRAKVVAIFQKKHTEMDTLFNQEIKPRIEAEFDSLRDEVAAVLDTQQAEDWKKHFDTIRAQLRPPCPPPPPPAH